MVIGKKMEAKPRLEIYRRAESALEPAEFNTKGLCSKVTVKARCKSAIGAYVPRSR